MGKNSSRIFTFWALMFVVLSGMTKSSWGYTQAQLTVQIERTFEGWANTYRTVSADANSCPVAPFPSGVTNLMDALSSIGGNIRSGETCIPDREQAEMLYSPSLPEPQRITRDELICRCVQRGTSDEAMKAGQMKDSEAAALTEAIRTRQDEAESSRENARKFGDTYGAALSTMNFARNQAEAEMLAGVYVSQNQESGMNVASLRRLLDPEQQNDSLCVSPREFILSQQLPTELRFYEDLAQPFNPTDWNYTSLANELKQYGSLENINRNEEAERKLARMKFLVRNPALKALFSSTTASGISNARQLHQLLQTSLPKPDCPTRGIDLDFLPCTRNNAAWKAQLPIYREAMRTFLSRPDVNRDFLAASALLPQTQINTAPFSETLSNPSNSNINQWRAFCRVRAEQMPPPSENPVQDEIESRFGLDFGNIDENRDFQNLNEFYCQLPRRNIETGRSSTFPAFRSTQCAGMSHRSCLAAFVHAYPGSDTTETVAGIGYTINEILENPDIIPPTTAASSGAVSSFGGDSSYRARAFEAFGGSEPPQSVLRQGSSATPTAQTANSPRRPDVSSNPLLSYTSGPSGIIAPVSDTQLAARAPEAAATPEVQRASLQRSNAEIERLRSELSDLNRDLARENAKTSSDRNNSQITEMNARLDSLSRNLEEAQRTNRALRDQIADSEARTPRPQARTETTSGSGDLGRSPASFGPVAASNGSSQAQSGSPSSMNPQTSGGQANLGGGVSSVGSGAARSVSLSAGNSALLSKYGVQSGSVQGALIVANASSQIDYQSLRSQSSESVIPLSLTPEEFNLIARNDQSVLNRYLDQVRAMPGNVVRLDVSATGVDGRPLEFFVVKNGNDFSIVPGVNSTPSRTPASLPAGARAFTLSNLRQELGN